MSVRFAFAGFRHGHIFGLLNYVNEHTDTTLVGACEEDADTRAALAKGDKVKITHDSLGKMLAEVDCDVVAIGDYYAKRGSVAIKALEAGKHVILDKPICTELDELKRMKKLADEKSLVVGCQLDLRAGDGVTTARRLIAEGKIGEVHTVTFTGQHPLLLGSRPGWYFEEGKHGGTINDIAIHACDGIPWITGRKFAEVVAARVWNAKASQYPYFQDGAQMMLKLDNGGGVLGDVSYLAPDGCGYTLAPYWRFSFHGSDGCLEIETTSNKITLAANDDKEPQTIAPDAGRKGGYFADFLDQVTGKNMDVEESTAAVLEASLIALTIQKAGDDSAVNVAIPDLDAFCS